MIKWYIVINYKINDISRKYFPLCVNRVSHSDNGKRIQSGKRKYSHQGLYSS